jgi:predicted RNA-binding Zn-ribbon protein involved in translation (DUF1610 family)
MVRLQAREAYIRDLDLAQRIQYVNTYLLDKILYMAQVLPAPSVQIRQIETAVAWFIWQGDIFGVPLSTLQKKKKGGWVLSDVETKCRALLLYRTWMQSRRGGEITAEWLRYWNLQTQRGNPPNVKGIPRNLEYLRVYARDKAYMEPPKLGEHTPTCGARIYETLRKIKMAANPPRNARITMRCPTTDWGRVWANLHGTWEADSFKANRYKVIHDILPTNERLHAIRLTVTPLCPNCGKHDTVIHRIIQCGKGQKIWEWTKNRIAWILRIDPVWIPNEWATRPQFKLWPPQRHRAVLWIPANLVWWRTRGGWTLSAQEYFDFLRTTRWKANQDTGRAAQVGNYLTILD